MTKVKIIFIALLILTAMLVFVGCAGENDALEGKYIVSFDVNGGTMDFGTSSTTGRVNFAYEPNTYIIDPVDPDSKLKYSISRNDFVFTGWYTSPECKSGEEWDFSKAFDVETLVLYAGWKPAIRYTYTLVYNDGTDERTLGTYEVNAGDEFSDWLGYSDDVADMTPIGFYSDPELSVAWNNDYKHPGGEQDLDIPVYVKYIEGNWIIVDSYEKLKNSIYSGDVYLVSDIDCGGAELFFSNDYNKVFEGNGYTVSNFTVKKSGTNVNPASGIFKALGQKAEVKNVKFANVTFKFFDIRESTDKVEVKANVAALAVNMAAGAKVTNVSVEGTFTTDYNGDLPCLDEVYYSKGEPDESVTAGVENFTANIIVDKQS